VACVGGGRGKKWVYVPMEVVGACNAECSLSPVFQKAAKKLRRVPVVVPPAVAPARPRAERSVIGKEGRRCRRDIVAEAGKKKRPVVVV